MRIMAKIKAFYNGEIIKPGTILEFKGEKLPLWAKEVRTSKKEQSTQNNEQNNKPGEQTGTNDEQNGTNGEQNTQVGEQQNETAKENKIDPQFAQELAGKSESELSAILDELLTKALDKGILIDTENKTIIEQINELTIKLSEENK